jgi:hypothetical protein
VGQIYFGGVGQFCIGGDRWRGAALAPPYGDGLIGGMNWESVPFERRVARGLLAGGRPPPALRAQ